MMVKAAKLMIIGPIKLKTKITSCFRATYAINSSSPTQENFPDLTNRWLSGLRANRGFISGNSITN